MFDLITKLQDSAVVKQVQVLDMVDESSAKFLKCCAELIDGSKLYLTESYVADKNKYSYHWQDSSNQLILRWDNARTIIITRHFHIIATKVKKSMNVPES